VYLPPDRTSVRSRGEEEGGARTRSPGQGTAPPRSPFAQSAATVQSPPGRTPRTNIQSVHPAFRPVDHRNRRLGDSSFRDDGALLPASVRRFPISVPARIPNHALDLSPSIPFYAGFRVNHVGATGWAPGAQTSAGGLRAASAKNQSVAAGGHFRSPGAGHRGRRRKN